MKIKQSFTKSLSVFLLLAFLFSFVACNQGDSDSSNQKDDSNSASQGLEYTQHGEGYYIVKSVGTCTDKNVIIPATYEGLPVKTIGNNAFENCKTIESIVLPESVQNIRKFSFVGCTALKSITLDHIQEIGASAFEGCTALTKVTLPSTVTVIEEKTFKGCKNMTTIQFPSKLVSIGVSAFEGCTKLSNLQLPDSVVTIGKGAFRECEALGSVTLPQKLSVLSSYTFEGCSNLKQVKIPDSVIKIEAYAFKLCDNLSKVFASGKWNVTAKSKEPATVSPTAENLGDKYLGYEWTRTK